MLAKVSMLIPFRYGMQLGVFELAKNAVLWAGCDRTADTPCHLRPLVIMSTASLGGVDAYAFTFPVTRLVHSYAAQSSASSAAASVAKRAVANAAAKARLCRRSRLPAPR